MNDAMMAGVLPGPGHIVRFVTPWRPDGGHRDELWAFCKPRWGHPVVEGASPRGPFNRSAAINAAAAGEWDTLVVLDADVIVDPAQVEAGIARAVETGRVTLPFARFFGLNEAITRRVMAGYTGRWEEGTRFCSDEHESSCVIVPRAVWDEVGGFDERFVGWGQEDVAFIQAARVLTGPIERIPGLIWHLWHERAVERDQTTPDYHANQALGYRYRIARKPAAIRVLMGERMQQVDVGREQIFRRIYASNAWNGVGTRAGPGSSLVATAGLRSELPKLLKKLGARSVLDAACGDSLWQPDLPGYVGIDIVREAVAAAEGAHPGRQYVVADICKDPLPRADVVLCRDAMQHMSFADGLAALENFRRSGARWLVASTHEAAANEDIETGGHYRINMRAAPFDLPEPLWTIPDGNWDHGVQWPGKMLGAWELRPARRRSAGTVVVLVPWRAGDELREQSWALVRPHLVEMGYPVVTGDAEGAWSRAAAINDAARRAGNWDVAIIADADTIAEPHAVRAAIDAVVESGGGIRPHSKLWRLTPSGSLVIARGGPEALEPRHMETTNPGGGLLVVSRDGWDRVGGYDERFVGWGHEDSVFNIALLLKAAWDRIPGSAWHLWHPAPLKNTLAYSRNRQLLEQMHRDNAAAIREKERAAGWAIGAVL